MEKFTRNLRSTKSCTFVNGKVSSNIRNSKYATEVKKQCKEGYDNWIEKFKPEVIEELAVHHKKVDEVKNFFKHCDYMKSKGSPNQIALLSGPSGAGKTATLTVLAQNLNIEILEWVTPVDIEIETTDFRNFQSSKEGQLKLFKYFVFQSSRYGNLFQTSSKRILLIEDFPNCILRNPESLEEIIQNYKMYGNSPVVFIVTDSRNRELNLSCNLFPDSVKEKYDIMHIRFNSVAPTLMKKALKRICSQVKELSKDVYKIPNQDVLNAISLSAAGDIRNAAVNLHFAMLKGPENLQFKKLTTNKKEQAKKDDPSPVGRDKTITLMHGLGRVFYPKYKENESCVFLHSPEELTEQFFGQHRNFVNFVHANYLLHFTKIENVLQAIDNISLSDDLLMEYRDNNSGFLGLNIVIRGVMVSNESPQLGLILIKAPNKKENRYITDNEQRVLAAPYASRNIFVSDMKSYIKVINKS